LKHDLQKSLPRASDAGGSGLLSAPLAWRQHAITGGEQRPEQFE
jgi:hypothetical protein